ncbi:MAG TPA: hypothetical protein VNS19_21170 [Acidimicrobiales bacterium]|nr:hypothetical protein [Acidimicrobiales bacterium]
MSDLIFLAVVAGFFALAVGLLRACEHIVGPDPAASTTASTTASPASAAAEPVEASA